MKPSIILSAILLIVPSSAYAQKSVLLNAMKDELARSMAQLKLDGEAGPYYISYQVEDTSLAIIAAESGAITSSIENRSRSMRIDLRVGSYTQDNSNYLSSTNISSIIGGSVGGRLPLDDDYYGLRRGFWLATDRAYKASIETLSKKKNYLQNTVQTDSLPDFAKGDAIARLAPEKAFVINKEEWDQRVGQIAKLLTGQPDIQRSRVVLNVRIVNSYYVNSEGAVVVEPNSIARLNISASTQAEDGMPLNSFRSYTARPEGLPEKAKIESDIKNMISELLAARTAPLAESYSGPVLFVGQAAGELFNQGFSGFLAARRQPISDSLSINRSQENPFLEKINMKVAANFLSLKAVPKLKNYGPQPLLGSCEIDDEGVPCQDVSLVENGILKNLLSSRTPVKGFMKSNGHYHGNAIAPSIVQITSTNKKPLQQLKRELVIAAKEEGFAFGYIVYGLTSVGDAVNSASDMLSTLLSRQGGSPEPTQFRLSNPYAVYRIYEDGREEPVRGIEFGSINITALRNILATSDDEIIYSFPVTGHEATVITPSLLVGGIDMKKSMGAGTYPKPPIVSPPNSR
jgi:predicted Zn-dependent protease